MQNPKIIIITGASSGIGAALALYYAGAGIALGLTGRDAARLEAVANACQRKGASVEARVISVTDRARMAEWIAAFHARHGQLDLVIANAGISGGTGGAPTVGEDPDQVRNLFATNVDGVLNTVEPVLPIMAAQKAGQIAIMSSLASFGPWPGAPAYGATKAAVRLYGEALAGSVRNKGIEVSVICPGFVRSNMTAVNDYPMPFLIDADRAAARIAAGLAAGRVRVAFPWPAYLIAGALGLLPPGLSTRFLAKLPKKPQSQQS